MCPAVLSSLFDTGLQQVALAASVLVDAMGSFSPIARQARRGAKPDSVVLMVGSCARGLPPATSADLLYSITELDRRAPAPRLWSSACAQGFMFCVQGFCCNPSLASTSMLRSPLGASRMRFPSHGID